jgi:DNA-binding MarR family transcriptional regulator/GNAT superfamily N-acetyltransferase
MNADITPADITPADITPAAVATIRRFSRTVTEQVGALNDSYLERDRPLGVARVLWEIGATSEDGSVSGTGTGGTASAAYEIGTTGAEVSALRERLKLDSGYLSRILRGLEADGLVTVATSPTDQRARRASLTALGQTEWRQLDRRSDESARSVVAPLTDSQRDRLVSAMATVTTLLSAAAVEITVVDPETDVAQHCLRQYFTEINSRFATGFDPAAALPTEPEAMRAPRGLFVVASLHGKPVGCGAVKFHANGLAEIKRVWISPEVRGSGLGRRMLATLEMHAAEHGATVIHLDSNAALTEAIALYRASGYVEVEPFNSEPYAHFWFEKHLA